MHDLAERVREQMIAALREISDPNAPPAPDSKPTPPLPEEAKGPVMATAPEPAPVTPPQVDRDLPTPATPALSEAYSLSEESVRRGSENDAETEEDEGMVLVGRPDR